MVWQFRPRKGEQGGEKGRRRRKRVGQAKKGLGLDKADMELQEFMRENNTTLAMGCAHMNG